MPEFGVTGPVHNKSLEEFEEGIFDALTWTRKHHNLDRRVTLLEEQMTNITQAEADLQNVVQNVVANTNALNAQVASLQAAIAAGNQAAVQQAADAIEASVATLQGTLPAAPTPTPAPTVPGAPTITNVTAGVQSANVEFTPADSTATGFVVTSSPGSQTGTGTSSPIAVSGLTTGTSYTFTVVASNAAGSSSPSAPSSSITAG